MSTLRELVYGMFGKLSAISPHLCMDCDGGCGSCRLLQNVPGEAIWAKGQAFAGGRKRVLRPFYNYFSCEIEQKSSGELCAAYMLQRRCES